MIQIPSSTTTTKKKRSFVQILAAAVFATTSTTTLGFSSSTPTRTRTAGNTLMENTLYRRSSASNSNSNLFGIAEWRDDVPSIANQPTEESAAAAAAAAEPSFDSLSFTTNLIQLQQQQQQQQMQQIQQQDQSSPWLSESWTTFSTSSSTYYNFGSPSADIDDQQQQQQHEDTIEQRSVPLLIVPSEQVGVVGETKYFHFVTNEEVRLFQQAVDHHHGVFGVGYVTTEDYAIVVDDDDNEDGNDEEDTAGGPVTESNPLVDRQPQQQQHQQQNQALPEEVLLDRLALMEITNYRYMDHNVDMGVICTAQTVGRATLKKVKVIENNRSKYSSSSSSSSSISKKRKNDNIVGDNSNNSDFHLAAICNEYFDEREDLYTLRDANEMARNVVTLIDEISQVEQQQQQQQQQYEQQLFQHQSQLSDGDDDDDDDEEEEESRKDRFCTAIRDVYESDSHGYHFIQQKSDEDGLRRPSSLKSWKELNAVSWAAYSSSANLQWDETYRLHALDMNSITNRLKLAEFWLADKLLETKQGVC